MVIIVGAGPAGISAALHLEREKKSYQIIEKHEKIGGLCKSFNLEGATFDFGGHAFFTKHSYVKELLKEVSPIPFFTQMRSAWVHSHETFLPYPFQANLYGLPSTVIAECLEGLFEVVRKQLTSPPKSIKEWIYQAFGDGIAKHFMIPYNEKIWSHPLDKISPNWASDRVVEPDFKAIISGAFSRKEFKDFPNAIVAYPADGGFERLVEYMASGLKLDETLVKGNVLEFDLKNSTVYLDDGSVHYYDKLISTIPLTELVKRTKDVPTACLKAAEKLKHFSLCLVNFVVNNNSERTQMQRIYSADPDVPFHKLVLNSNSSSYLKEKSVFSIQAEISFSLHKPLSNRVEEEVLQSLLKMGVIKNKSEIIASSKVMLPLAYPVYTDDWASARKEIFSHYEQCQVYCAGRFGEWLYINSDDAIMRGRLAAEKVLTKDAAEV